MSYEQSDSCCGERVPPSEVRHLQEQNRILRNSYDTLSDRLRNLGQENRNLKIEHEHALIAKGEVIRSLRAELEEVRRSRDAARAAIGRPQTQPEWTAVWDMIAKLSDERHPMKNGTALEGVLDFIQKAHDGRNLGEALWDTFKSSGTLADKQNLLSLTKSRQHTTEYLLARVKELLRKEQDANNTNSPENTLMGQLWGLLKAYGRHSDKLVHNEVTSPEARRAYIAARIKEMLQS